MAVGVISGMDRRRGMTAVLLAFALITAGVTVLIGIRDRAAAHGSMESPASRIYNCYAERVSGTLSPACQDAIAIGGEQAVYDWREVNQPNAGGNHRAVVPDGMLCSGGRDKYRGFDQPRADWGATAMTAGAPYDFKLAASAPHKGTLDLYITRDGYDPTRPLRWADLEDAPFLTIAQEQAGGVYAATGTVPAGKHGRHVIYGIWQRTDSPEAFYSCSDVTFDGSSGVVAPPAPVPAMHQHGQPDPVHHPESTSPSPQPVPPADENVRPVAPVPAPVPVVGPETGTWQPGVEYAAGATVSFDGRPYRAQIAHRSQIGWEPPIVPALWSGVPVAPPAGQSATWQPQIGYATGAEVVHAGTVYRCLQGHVSQLGWEPPAVPALWQPIA